jgi:hypothetical protein
LSTGDFERRIRRALRMEHLTLNRLRERDQGKPPLLVNIEDTLEKDSGTGILIGAPLQLRTWNLEGGSYTGVFERCLKKGSSNRPSISEELYEGDLEGGLLYWRPPKDMSSKALEMGVCFHSGHAFGKHGGALFLQTSD